MNHTYTFYSLDGQRFEVHGSAEAIRALAEVIYSRNAPHAAQPAVSAKPVNQHGQTCAETCGEMAASGFHSLLCHTVETEVARRKEPR